MTTLAIITAIAIAAGVGVLCGYALGCTRGEHDGARRGLGR